ncbi:MAG: sugar kinase [Candidatus Omnitrophica bacterium]|nr:sugar kinase [Candidatus Omnitrophota bacterium]
MSLLVLGTVALDSVRTPAGLRRKMLGGSAVHFSMSARLFTPVALVGVIGFDFPKEYIRLLRRKGINLDSLKRAKGKTFHWQGEYKGDMNSAITINTELGVLISSKPILAPEHRKIKNIFLANIDPDDQRLVLDLVHQAEFVGLDSMNYWIDNKKKSLLKVMKRVHLFVANEHEARSLTGEFNLIKAAKNLSSLGPEIIVIKKGEHGLIFYTSNFLFCLPAYPITGVVDPTGAGDTFAGALMGYLSSHKKNSSNIKKALCNAVVCASFNVEGFGLDVTKDLEASQLCRRIREFKKITSI